MPCGYIWSPSIFGFEIEVYEVLAFLSSFRMIIRKIIEKQMEK